MYNMYIFSSNLLVGIYLRYRQQLYDTDVMGGDDDDDGKKY